MCGTKNDRSVRYSLGRSTSPMAVAAYTYDKLPQPNRRLSRPKDTLLQRLSGQNRPSQTSERMPYHENALGRCPLAPTA